MFNNLPLHLQHPISAIQMTLKQYHLKDPRVTGKHNQTKDIYDTGLQDLYLSHSQIVEIRCPVVRQVTKIVFDGVYIHQE